MNILGISHPVSLNAAACLLKNGKLVAFAEEERFNRIKHSPSMPADKSIKYCLKQGEISLDEVDFIGIGYDRFLNIMLSNTIEHLSTFFYRNSLQNVLNNYITTSHKRHPLDYAIPQFISNYYQGLFRLPFNYRDKRVHFIRHHIAHSASVFYVSGFDQTCIISADGGGGQEAGILAIGAKEQIKIIKRIPSADSLGYLYTSITSLLGFEPNDGEGKVMGLAAFAKTPAKILPFVSFNDGIVKIDHTLMSLYLNKVKSKLSSKPLSSTNVNLAAALQKTVEEAYIYMAKFLYNKTGIRDFCLTGGVSLNCLANTKVSLLPFVNKVFIQPAAHDAGTALGAALQVFVNIHGKRPDIVFDHPYFGPQFSDHEIIKIIRSSGIQYYKKSNNIEQLTARLLKKGKIIGWFQGKMEVGARALGNRSILADPSKYRMKDEINKRIKNREGWRPFAPSILEEYSSRYLLDIKESPFMILSSRIKPDHAKEIAATAHVDNTVRPQTVSKKTNPRFWNLINEFKKLSGIPALLNTSFNLSGEPIVCSPSDAISTFFRTGFDYLVLGNYLIAKKPFDKYDIILEKL